jgi:hypothetical protein
MATTINSFSVGLTLDAKDYIDASKLSRQETNLLKKDINAARDPAEEFSRANDRLTRAYQSGAIELSTYNRLLDMHKDKLEKATKSSNSKSSSLEKLSQISNAVTASIHAARAAIDVFASAKDAFDEVTNRIDATAKSAQRLSMSFNELASLRFAAGEFGVQADLMERGLQEMIKRGFSTGDARESFMQIADEIAGMATQAERMQRAYEVFGKSGAELLPMLQSGRDAIGESVDFANQWNSLTNAQVVGVEQYNDTWGRVYTIVEGVTNTLVAELAPVMTLIGESIIGAAGSFVDVKQTIHEIVDTSVYLAGWLKDINDIVSLQQRMWYRITTLDFSGMMDDLNEAATFDTAEKWLQATADKRHELYKQGLDRQQKLDQQKIDAVAQAELERAKKLEDEKAAAALKAQEQLDKEIARLEAERTRQLQTALSNAAKEIEKQASDAKKMVDSIAKGPESFEVGSSAAAGFLAAQVNRAIAEAAVEFPQDSETALLEEAQKQLEEMRLLSAKQDEQVDALRQLVDVTSQNGFKRLR